MKVRVIKKHNDHWYNKFIGKVFEVDGIIHPDNDYKVVGDSKKWLRKNDNDDLNIAEWWIRIEDCEVIEEMQIGDKVKVINIGDNYSTYPDWIKDNAPQYKNLYKNENYFEDSEENDIYTIVAKGKHRINNEDLVLIKNGERVFLLKEEGLKKITMKKSDLKTGMLVQLASKNWYIVVTNGTKEVCYLDTDILLDYNCNSFIVLGDYNDNLSQINDGNYYNEFNIIKVAKTECPRITFKAYKEGIPVEQIKGFEIIFQRESEEQIKLKQEIEELKRQLAEKENLYKEVI